MGSSLIAESVCLVVTFLFLFDGLIGTTDMHGLLG